MENPGPQRTKQTVLLIAAAILTLGFLAALGANLAPWLRGPEEWRWAYAIPGTASRLWLSVLLLALYVLAAWHLLPRRETKPGEPLPRRRVALVLLLSMAMTPAIQLALLYMDHPDVRSQLFYRTVSEHANGFFNVGAVVMDRDDFVRYYADRMLSWYPTHPERHPPGLPVLFSLARQFFDAHPRLTWRLNEIYRPYQCQNVPLMNLPDGAIASATLQMALPFLLSLVVWPLYQLGREAYDQATAVRAVLLWPLIPGIALWAAFWTPVFALFTVLALLLLHYGLSRHKGAYLYLSGLVISISSFLSFGNVAIVGFLGIYALTWLAAASSRPRWRWLLWGALLFVLGAATLWVGIWFRHGLSFFAVWNKAIGKHFEMNRVGWFWILYQLYDFFIASASVPICVFWLAYTGGALRDIWRRRRPLDVMAIAYLLGLILLDLSGAARGEVARVWAFMLPLPALVAVSRLPRRRIYALSLIVLTSLHLLVANVFVRYIGTDLIDPPLPPPAAKGIPADEWLATWDRGISLQSAQLPANAQSGETIAVKVTWTTSQQINRPYTVFVHLYDDKGNLVAQRDTMPLDGGWPTTCWRPGQSFQDRYTLTVPSTAVAATYHAYLGLYWLPTGQRLSLVGQDTETVDLGRIEIRPAATD